MHGKHQDLVQRYFPAYQSPKRAYGEALDSCVQPGCAWLDVGCGRQLTADSALSARLAQRSRLLVGCDAAPRLKDHPTIPHLVRCDARALPFRPETFDVVSAAMVVEHLPHPEQVFREIARVSKPEGKFIVFTPNKFNYAMVVARLTPQRFHSWYKRLTHGLNRGEWRDFSEDLFPTWYRANTVTRLRQLLLRAGFRAGKVERLSLAHSFGFVRPLFVLSLLFERLINRPSLDALKANLLAVFSKPGKSIPVRDGDNDKGMSAAAARSDVSQEWTAQTQL